jgi:hypothetical protein
MWGKNENPVNVPDILITIQNTLHKNRISKRMKNYSGVK